MDRRKPLARKTPMRKRNPERLEKLRAEQFGTEAFRKWMRMQECCIPGCGVWPADIAHVTSRGAGGTSDDVVPLCRAHHQEQHNVGIVTFQERHNVDLVALAVETQTRWALYQGEE